MAPTNLSHFPCPHVKIILCRFAPLPFIAVDLHGLPPVLAGPAFSLHQDSAVLGLVTWPRSEARSLCQIRYWSPNMAVKPASPRKASAVDKLSDYDDLCTDLLIDRVEFWAEVHKMAPHYSRRRHPSGDEVVDVIRTLIRDKKTSQQAAESILRYPSCMLLSP